MGNWSQKFRNIFMMSDEYKVGESSLADSVTNITELHQGTPEGRYGGGAASMKRNVKTEMVLISASSYTDVENMVSAIADALREGKSVIANVEDTQPNMRNRIIDFSSGMVHIINGSTERIDKNIYLFAHNNMSVTRIDASQLSRGYDDGEYGDGSNTIY